MLPHWSTISVLGRSRKSAQAPILYPSTLSGLTLWVRVAAATGFADNDPVGSIADLSPTNATITSTGSDRPLYKTGIVNGKPVLRFDGSSDCLVISESISTREVWAVANSSAASFSGNRFLYGGSQAWIVGSGTAPGTNLLVVSGLQPHLVNNAVTASFLPMSTFKSVGVYRTSAVSNTSLTIGKFYSGGFAWPGDLAELVTFNRALTTQERADLHAYFQSEYAL